MNDRYRERSADVIGVALIALGLLFVLGGWIGLRDERSVVEQIPYLASGGIGGLALIGAGATVLHMVRQFRVEREIARLEARQEAMEQALDRFVESMTDRFDLRVPLTAVTGNGRRRRQRAGEAMPVLRGGDAGDAGAAR